MSLPKYCWIVDLESLGRWNIKAITKTEDVEVFTAETSTESSHEQQPVSNPILLGCYPIFHINRIRRNSPMIFHQLVTLRAWQLLTESETGSPHTSWSWTFQCGCRTLLQAAASATTLVHFFIGPLPKLLWWSWWSMVESQSITAITSSELGIHESCQEKHPMFKHHPSIFED